MSKILRELEIMVDDFGSAPTLGTVERRTLADKGIAESVQACRCGSRKSSPCQLRPTC